MSYIGLARTCWGLWRSNSRLETVAAVVLIVVTLAGLAGLRERGSQ